MYAMQEPPAIVSEAPLPGTAEGAPITVTAPAGTPETMAREFLKQVLPVPTLGQYARWTQPVCVKVYGLEPALETRVRIRVEAVAKEAGASVGGMPCKPNIGIVFTGNAQQQIVELRKRRGRLLADLPLQEIRALRASRHPVVWWRTAAATDGVGTPATGGSAAIASAPGAGETPLATSFPGGGSLATTSAYRSSLISTNLSLSVGAAVALVDVELAEGKSLDSVADYVAFVTIGPVRFPADPTGVPTILDLFSADTPGMALSGWDRALLSANMRMQLDRTARWQAGKMRAQMVREQKESAQGAD